MATPGNSRDTDLALTEEINASLSEGKLPCPLAFKVADKLNIIPITVGKKTDEMGIKISDCQLGCFGKGKVTREALNEMEITPSVTDAIQASLVNGKIPCKTSHDLSRTLKVSRKRVGDTASKLNIKVSDCQLGCF